MGIRIIVNFSGWFPPNKLVLVSCTLLVICRYLVIMLNNILFPFTSGKRSSSQGLVTCFPRILQATPLNYTQPFLFSEMMLLFAADTCVLPTLSGKQTTPTLNLDLKQEWSVSLIMWVVHKCLLQTEASFLKKEMAKYN